MDETTLNQMRKLLDEAKTIIKLPDPVADVNLFSILGMENKEVSAHSAFLYYVLKPFTREDGTVNDDHLRLFLKTLLPDIRKPDFVEIYREYPTDFGRIDFLIVFSNDVKQDAVVIELKIWAGEQPEQLTRYRSFLKKRGYSPDNLFFLTPDDRTAQTGEAKNITLKNEIMIYLEKIADIHRVKNPAYSTVLLQYIELIKMLIGEFSTMSEVSKLFHSAYDIQLVDKLYDAKNEALANLIESLLLQINQNLTVNDTLNIGDKYPALSFIDTESIKHEHIQKYYKKHIKCFPALCYRVDDVWLKKLKPEYREILSKKNEKIALYFFVEVSNVLFVGITPRSHTGSIFENSYVDKKDLQHLIEKDAHNPNEWFWNKDSVLYAGKEISFADYQNRQKGMLRLLKKDESEMVFDPIIIHGIVEEIQNIIREQCNMFFNIAKGD